MLARIENQLVDLRFPYSSFFPDVIDQLVEFGREPRQIDPDHSDQVSRSLWFNKAVGARDVIANPLRRGLALVQRIEADDLACLPQHRLDVPTVVLPVATARQLSP